MTIKRVKLWILFFILALVIGTALILRWLPARGAKEQLAAIRAAGLPTSGIELNTYYKGVPVMENRALLLLDITRDLVAAPRELFEKKPEEVPHYYEKVEGYVATNKAVISKLHGIRKLPGSRFPVDFSAGISTLLPHVASLKSAAYSLALDARWQAHEGNAEGACESIESGFAVAEAIQQEPILISDLVAIANFGITAGALEHVLNEIQLQDEQLARLSTIIARDDAGGLDGLYRALAGERAIGISAFKSNYKEFEGMSSGGGSSSSGEWLKILAFQAYSVSGLRERDLKMYLEMMGLLINSTRAGFPGAVTEMAAADRSMQKRFSTGLGRIAILSRMLLPALSGGARKTAAQSARFRCAEIALAVERFRLTHNGSLPVSTEELVPKYLHNLPIDPFDSTPLLYERLSDKGYRVISRGASAERKSATKTADDVGITVNR